MSPELELVLARLEKVRKQGSNYEARCPAHEDRHASLSVKDGDLGVVIKCHAGCPTELILEYIGMSTKDLFYDHHEHEEAEKVYDYTDENGRLLYRVHRFPQKRFRQQRADGEWTMQGVTRVLYRLPEVLQAVKDNRFVFITEGEKDADAIVEAGGIATTNVGGAGKWSDDYSRVLRGAHCRVVADQDEPGRLHANAVAAALEGSCASVQVVAPAHGKDASDHLTAGFTLEDFAPVEPETGLILVRLGSVTPEDVNWIEGHRNRFAYGKLALVTGMPSTNKTTIVLGIAADLSRKEENSLVVSAEDGLPDLRARVEAAGGDPNRVFGGYMRRDGVDGGLILMPSDIPQLAQRIERENIRLLVIDPIQAHFGPDVDSNRDQSVRYALAPLAMVASRTGCCVIIINHLTKESRERNPMIRAGGSIGIAGIARTCLLMANHPDHHANNGHRVLASFKNSYGPLAESLEYRLEPAAVNGYHDLVIRLTQLGAVNMSARALLSNQPKGDN